MPSLGCFLHVSPNFFRIALRPRIKQRSDFFRVGFTVLLGVLAPLVSVLFIVLLVGCRYLLRIFSTPYLKVLTGAFTALIKVCKSAVVLRFNAALTASTVVLVAALIQLELVQRFVHITFFANAHD